MSELDDCVIIVDNNPMEQYIIFIISLKIITSAFLLSFIVCFGCYCISYLPIYTLFHQCFQQSYFCLVLLYGVCTAIFSLFAFSNNFLNVIILFFLLMHFHPHTFRMLFSRYFSVHKPNEVFAIFQVIKLN